MKSFGLTDRGAVRKDNQDSFLIEKYPARDCLVLAIADGMGGAKAGGLASQLANRAFVNTVYERLGFQGRNLDYRMILRAACEDANGVAYEYSRISEEYEGMGTTLVGGVINSRGNGYIINVGDSRAYLISRRGILQITRDHSLVADLVSIGAISPEQAKTHPRRNVITRALGTDEKVEPDYFQFRLRRGETLLLCTDGLSNMLTDEELQAIALQERQPESICRRMMSLALERGARDNVTVVAVTRT